MRACVGVGSSANRYACVTSTVYAASPTAWMARSARRRAEPRPYRRAHIDMSTSVMSPTRSSSTSRSSTTTRRRPRGSQRRLDILHAESREPLAMLHHHDPHRRVAKQPLELRPRSVQPRANLRHRARDPEAPLRSPGRQPADLPIKIVPLPRRGNPRVQRHTHNIVGRRLINKDRARHRLTRRHGQRSPLEPLPRRLVVNPLALGPVRQLHATEYQS